MRGCNVLEWEVLRTRRGMIRGWRRGCFVERNFLGGSSVMWRDVVKGGGVVEGDMVGGGKVVLGERHGSNVLGGRDML